MSGGIFACQNLAFSTTHFKTAQREFDWGYFVRHLFLTSNFNELSRRVNGLDFLLNPKLAITLAYINLCRASPPREFID